MILNRIVLRYITRSNAIVLCGYLEASCMSEIRMKHFAGEDLDVGGPASSFGASHSTGTDIRPASGPSVVPQWH